MVHSLRHPPALIAGFFKMDKVNLAAIFSDGSTPVFIPIFKKVHAPPIAFVCAGHGTCFHK
jgi:hypothetical protein